MKTLEERIVSWVQKLVDSYSTRQTVKFCSALYFTSSHGT
jgi:hypothetical protein